MVEKDTERELSRLVKACVRVELVNFGNHTRQIEARKASGAIDYDKFSGPNGPIGGGA